MFSKPLTLYEAGGFSYMQSWLNWYSIGPENRHSERISGFESQALRSAPLAQLVEHLTFNQRVGSSSLLRGIMHEWRSWYTPDLGSDAEMHVGSNPTSCTVQCIGKE